MTELTVEQIVANLSKPLNDDVYTRVEKYYPVAKDCPTCGGSKIYSLLGIPYECDCRFQKILQRNYFAANIGREYHDICLKDFIGGDRDKIVEAVESYLDDYEGNFHYGLGITFSGSFGTGKTFAMCCILKELIKQGKEVYFVTFDELIDIWGSSWHDDTSKMLLQDKLKSVDFLGLDEVKTDGRNAGGFLANGLDNVIRHRTSNLLPTFVTTNMSPDQEEKEFGKVYSLLSARNQRIDLTGKDLRQNEIRVKVRTLKERGERRPIC